MTPEHAISLAYNGKQNIMTPNRLNTGWIKEPTIAYEISTGDGPLSGVTMYGVSIVYLERGKWQSSMKLSKCLHSRIDALHYIESLRESESST